MENKKIIPGRRVCVASPPERTKPEPEPSEKLPAGPSISGRAYRGLKNKRLIEIYNNISFELASFFATQESERNRKPLLL